MLTTQEITDARDKLRAACLLIESVGGVFLSAGCVNGARLVKDAAGLLADEIAALEKAIANED